MNFKVNKLYLVVLLALLSMSLIGQTKERYIPIVQYEPYRFYATVMDAFYRLPNYDYVRVTDDGKEKHYFLNLGTETDGLRYFQPVSGEIDFDSDSESIFSFENIDNIMESDSLFILYFESPRTRGAAYKALFPFSYYGVITNGKIKYYENKKGYKEPLTLSEAIERRYGSIEKYKELMVSMFVYAVDNNIGDNGLYKIDKEYAIGMLRSDFIYYWECFPQEDEKILDLFVSFMKKNILVDENQVSEIRKEILNSKKYAEQREDIRIPNSGRYPKSYTSTTIEVLGFDVYMILKNILTSDQFKSLTSAYKKQSSLRKVCLYAVGTQAIKVADIKGKYQEILVWDSNQNRHVMKKLEGKYRSLKREELIEYQKETVFGKKYEE